MSSPQAPFLEQVAAHFLAEDLDLECLSEEDSLSIWGSVSCLSTASCPYSTYSSLSSLGG